MSALMIATITVKDPAKFQEYLAKTQEVARPYGAKLLHRAKVDRVLTGQDRDHGVTVVVSFPSSEKINEWYGSDDYQALVALREEGTDMRMVSYDVMN